MDNPILKLLRARWASRSISPDPLPEGTIQELIEAVQMTPSCFNNQPWRFLFLESPEALAKGREALSEGNQAWANRAPLLVFGYTRQEDDCVLPDGRVYHQFDLGMSVMNLILSATSHKLVARPMAGFNPAHVREVFGLDQEDHPLVAVAIGELSENEDHLPDRLKGLNDKPRERKNPSAIVQRM